MKSLFGVVWHIVILRLKPKVLSILSVLASSFSKQTMLSLFFLVKRELKPSN